MECIVRDLTLNYEIIGEGKPILMIHGYGVDHKLMTGCMEPMFSAKENYKRIYLDLPGMGKSQCSERIINSDIMLEIVMEFINKIIPNENFLVAGESYGGYITRGLVYKMPERIDGVLLICPVILPKYSDRNVSEHIVLVKDEQVLSKLTTEEASSFNDSTVVQSERIYERYKKEIISGVELANEEFIERFIKTGYSFTFEVDKLDKKFDKPALILLGRQDDCVGYKDAWNILDNYPRATFAVLDKAGHNLQIEQEELFSALVKEWLKN
ncbi:alpha/beta fold hydrolase [Clostridium sp. 'White wine YQ']|uniref:alpha/beta fold hydrolase n=1 Tax=Clostridium sp. 'White wine YQ' TaxID=3027474 RepID=UPI002365894A|nr:alpha/beta hydrolase [Clostridium sp. 'White wine YQ']MDD7794233.1 alpha/beta hydrolase [Clostridium sp. 'White wine YQ']